MTLEQFVNKVRNAACALAAFACNNISRVVILFYP